MGDIRAILTKPNTRSAKVNTSPFICDNCALSYKRSHYKILYESKKLAYFLLYPNWDKKSEKFLLCHECFHKSVMKICEEFEFPVLTVKLKEGRKWLALDFYYTDDEGPISPEDLDLF